MSETDRGGLISAAAGGSGYVSGIMVLEETIDARKSGVTVDMNASERDCAVIRLASERVKMNEDSSKGMRSEADRTERLASLNHWTPSDSAGSEGWEMVVQTMGEVRLRSASSQARKARP